MITLASNLIQGAKRLIYSSPLGAAYAPKYRYFFSPAELTFMCNCLERGASLKGPVGEIGCFRGDTTIFLSRFMDDIGYTAPYYAFDTFEGFTADDVQFETDTRGKDAGMLASAFAINKQGSFDRTMAKNGCRRVVSRRADANHHSFSELDACSFCLIDLDLYRPVLSALEAIYPRTAPGGVIVVDDCRETEHHYDGAAQAYREFVARKDLAPRIMFGKLGILEKPKS